jgi:hypothetical protein
MKCERCGTEMSSREERGIIHLRCPSCCLEGGAPLRPGGWAPLRWSGLAAGWAFRMVFWKHKHHERMSDGDIIRALEELARKPNAFAYPIEYIKPKR